MTTHKPKLSEIFEGPNSSLRRTFEGAVLHKSCTGIDCPERTSICCGADSNQIAEGTGYFTCAKCGKEFKGGECTAGDKAESVLKGERRRVIAQIREEVKGEVRKVIEGLKKDVCKNPACGRESHPCDNTIRHQALTDVLTSLEKMG